MSLCLHRDKDERAAEVAATSATLRRLMVRLVQLAQKPQVTDAEINDAIDNAANLIGAAIHDDLDQAAALGFELGQAKDLAAGGLMQ